MTIFDPLPMASVPPLLPIITTSDLQLDYSNPPEGGFTFFTTNVTITTAYLDLIANVDGVRYTQDNFD